MTYWKEYDIIQGRKLKDIADMIFRWVVCLKKS